METILLVDDDEHVRPMIRDILELSGYNVLDASDGDRALEIVASHPDRIHLLLTDVMMPGLTGPELAHQLRPRRPGMKVLYMSGFTPADFRSRTIEFEPGASILSKPFSVDGLTRRVNELLAADTAAQSANSRP